MRYHYCFFGLVLSGMFAVGVVSGVYEATAKQPIALHPTGTQIEKPIQPQEPKEQHIYPTSREEIERPAQPQKPREQQSGEQQYAYPTSRGEIEKAASQCKAEIIELWDQRRNLPPYRMAMFQKSIGEAQVRCRKLEAIVDSLQKADEQLYTYQRSLNQARSAFE